MAAHRAPRSIQTCTLTVLTIIYQRSGYLDPLPVPLPGRDPLPKTKCVFLVNAMNRLDQSGAVVQVRATSNDPCRRPMLIKFDVNTEISRYRRNSTEDLFTQKKETPTPPEAYVLHIYQDLVQQHLIDVVFIEVYPQRE
jgi:hypothetical protein